MKGRWTRVPVAAAVCLLLLTSAGPAGAGPVRTDQHAPSSEVWHGALAREGHVPGSGDRLAAPASRDGPVALLDGPRVVLIHDDRYVPHRVPAPSGPAVGIQAAPFDIQWNPDSCDSEGSVSPWPEDAKQAFSFAVNVWRTLLSSTPTIEIDACWLSDLPSGVLGAAGPLVFYRDVPNEPVANSWYPVALANMLAGADLNGQESEIMALFSATFDWHYGTDGNTPVNRVDFVTVVVHELCHGLGFVGSMTYDDGDGEPECNGLPGYGCWGLEGYPLVYDRFTEDGDGRRLMSYPNGSTSLGDALLGQAGGSVVFNGAHAIGANTDNGHAPVELYTPATWIPGSSYSHLGQAFEHTPNALMTYDLANGESIHHPGPVALGIFEDMGWEAAHGDAPERVYLPAVTRGWPPMEPSVVVNGGFEAGPVGWTENSTDPWHLIVQDFPTGVTPHSGSWAAWLGGENNHRSSVEQRVAVSPGGPYLAYWHWIRSLDLCGRDVAGVSVNGSPLNQYDLCLSQDTGGWVKHVVDLRAYAGQTVELRIWIANDASSASSLFVDDVSFQTGASTAQTD